MYLTSKLSNLVSPASEAFTPDELSVIVGTCLPDAVAVLDSDGTTILGGNERLEELLGFEIGEGSGDGYRSFDEFVHADDRERRWPSVRPLRMSWIATAPRAPRPHPRDADPLAPIVADRTPWIVHAAASGEQLIPPTLGHSYGYNRRPAPRQGHS